MSNNDTDDEWEDFFRMLLDEPKPQEEKTEPIEETVLNIHLDEPKKLFTGFFEQMEELEKVTDPSKFQELIDYIKELHERYGIEED